ncbi:MAG TPA: HEAT repeat domain-containing protein [Gemmataceae bacterium]|jgi:HEAT repeat protein|nr:HEAT repeat domain-containing protein [Gemmataceae bacterium]
MKKRLLIGFGVLLAFVTFAVLILPEYRLTVLGYFRGENFFEGRSTSYWRYAVDSYVARMENPAGKTNFEKLLEYLHITGALEKPSVLGRDPKAVPVLIDLIRDKSNRRVGMQAYTTLANQGPSAREALPVLEEEMNCEDPYFRVAALNTLGRFGAAGVPSLIRGLKHHDAIIRSYSAHRLGEMGQDAKKAIPALREALKDQEKDVRVAAALALAHIDLEEAIKAGADRLIPQPSSDPNAPQPAWVPDKTRTR